jgi:hypothetical protein
MHPAGAAMTTRTAASSASKPTDGGSGRSDNSTVAWRVFEDHPMAGAGLNFGVVAKDYLRRPGALQRGDLTADKSHVMHNTYLQLMFEAQGESGLEALARAVLVAAIAIPAAGFFISSGVDRRLWILFGLGPSLLHVASRSSARASRARLYSGLW